MDILEDARAVPLGLGRANYLGCCLACHGICWRALRGAADAHSAVLGVAHSLQIVEMKEGRTPLHSLQL